MIPSEYDEGLVGRRAIYIPFAQAIPKVPVIDRTACMHFLRENVDACRSCENFCGPKAIDYDQEDEIVEIEAGAVILAPGYDVVDPDSRKNSATADIPMLFPVSSLNDCFRRAAPTWATSCVPPTSSRRRK